MKYDEKVVGIGDFVLIAKQYPTIYAEIERVIEKDIDLGLELAKKAIKAHNNGLIDK
jgi:hypothetical protein